MSSNLYDSIMSSSNSIFQVIQAGNFAIAFRLHAVAIHRTYRNAHLNLLAAISFAIFTIRHKLHLSINCANYMKFIIIK